MSEDALLMLPALLSSSQILTAVLLISPRSIFLNFIPAGYYAIRIRATTANAGAGLVAAVATAMEVWRLFDLTEGLTDNSTATKNYFPAELYQQDISGVGAYISSVTALQSRVTAFIRER